MQEERAVNEGILPVNMMLHYQFPRDTFDEFIDPWESPQLRLKRAKPSNEVLCLAKDDVGKTCPQLMPPEETLAPPPWGMCGGGAPLAQPDFQSTIGDGYVLNYGVRPNTTMMMYQGGRVLQGPSYGRWYFPKPPTATGLRDNTAPTLKSKTVGGAAGGLSIKVTRNRGGAITSIVHKGQEFLLTRADGMVGHDAALQMSAAINIPPGGNDQQRRANEAGASWNKRTSASRLLRVAAGTTRTGKRAVFTETQAAYWRRPGSAFGRNRVLNTTTLSPLVMAKRVTVAKSSFRYVAGVKLSEVERAQNIRTAVRFSLKRQFNRVMAFNSRTQRWVALAQSRTLAVGKYRALAITDASGEHAIGFTLTDFPKPPRGYNFNPKAFYAVNVTNGGAGTLVSLVHQVGVRGGVTSLPSKTYAYHTHFEVGDLESVTKKLATLAINLDDATQYYELRKGWTPSRMATVCRRPLRLWKPTEDWLDTVGDLGQGGGGLFGDGPVTYGPWHAMGAGGRRVKLWVPEGAGEWVTRPGFEGQWMRIPERWVRSKKTGKMVFRPARWMSKSSWHKQLRKRGFRQVNGRWVTKGGMAALGGRGRLMGGGGRGRRRPMMGGGGFVGGGGRGRRRPMMGGGGFVGGGGRGRRRPMMGGGGFVGGGGRRPMMGGGRRRPLPGSDPRAWSPNDDDENKKSVPWGKDCRMRVTGRCKGCDKRARPGCDTCKECKDKDGKWGVVKDGPVSKKEYEVTKKCRLSARPGCDGCELHSDKKRCRGCTVCETVKVEPDDDKPNKETVCRLSVLKKCKENKCKLHSNKKGCEACTICETTKTKDEDKDEKKKTKDNKIACRVSVLKKCKDNKCELHSQKKGCEGCTICEAVTDKPVTTAPPPKGAAKCYVRDTSECKKNKCGLGSKKKACTGCIVCTYHDNTIAGSDTPMSADQLKKLLKEEKKDKKKNKDKKKKDKKKKDKKKKDKKKK